VLRSFARWLRHNLLPSTCPECGALLTPVLRRSAAELGALLRPGDPRAGRLSDWLCCEECSYLRALDLFDPA
jgi:hypothetical protein